MHSGAIRSPYHSPEIPWIFHPIQGQKKRWSRRRGDEVLEIPPGYRNHLRHRTLVVRSGNHSIQNPRSFPVNRNPVGASQSLDFLEPPIESSLDEQHPADPFRAGA
jgi:hypothetical protein